MTTAFPSSSKLVTLSKEDISLVSHIFEMPPMWYIDLRNQSTYYNDLNFWNSSFSPFNIW